MIMSVNFLEVVLEVRKKEDRENAAQGGGRVPGGSSVTER